jgi:hypothetical protein
VRFQKGIVRWKFDDGARKNPDLLAADLITVITATALRKQLADSYFVDYLTPQKAAASIFNAALAGIADYLQVQARIQSAA